MFNKLIKGVKYGLGIGICIAVLFFCAYSDTHYTRTGFIKHISKSNLYVFTDNTGNEWKIENSDMLIPYNSVAFASVKMFTNNTTDYIYDDMIVNIEIVSAVEN